MTMSEAPAPSRRPRSDGLRRRRAILLAAANLSATRGLDRLSIGELAEHAGMSKSGLFAHFGSKEVLQLATIDMAREIYDREIVEPAGAAAPGVERLLALTEGFIGHLDRRIFAGACFFASAGSEFRATPGPVRDRLEAFQAGWNALLEEHVALARQAGDLPGAETVADVVFEIESYLMKAHLAFGFNGDPRVLDLARAAVRRRLRRQP
jgi:AcrR family transcriptional regulator